MARVVGMKRGRGGARQPDLSDLRDLMGKDGRVWVELAVVEASGTGQHWERDRDGDLLVEVVTVPRGRELLCRLGSTMGGPGTGGWRVPAVGTEVLVASPEGEGDHATIVACLSSGGAPARAGADRTVIVAPDAIEVDAPAIRLGGENATRGGARLQDTAKLTLSVVDLVALATALLSTGAFLPTGSPPAGGTPPPPFTDGEITSASTVVKVR